MRLKHWLYAARRPWLLLPSSFLYALSPLLLKVYSRLSPAPLRPQAALRRRGIVFKNPFGTAGGVDKNAALIKEWSLLGAGFLEIGTVTPEPQKANAGKILDRSLKHLSLWNNMGFPNKGLDFVKKRLQAADRSKLPPLFINIGKNRGTPLAQAAQDYKKSLRALHPFASAFVVNISSPNTKDLRGLFDKSLLPSFLKDLKEAMAEINSPAPLILKLSPDEKDFFRIIEQSLEAGIEGWCLCNSSKDRSGLNPFPEKGGVSGKLLADKSLKLLKELKRWLKDRPDGKDRLIISCGGVLTVKEALERLREGADLVQVYSALVFEGPGFFKKAVKQALKKGRIRCKEAMLNKNLSAKRRYKD